ncbi:unnamed protein product [Thelazia callipaeda]|uniref:BTB domain-containing protein n=1 Tax=Thelazia callipaeda TaxID=103827 RepID=A0A0N5D6X9_THECL|nr:unnamed protein product [Thelazia callipaeda]
MSASSFVSYSFLGHTFYVNPGWLAELSSFFATMFFLNNAGEDIILSDEVKYENFLELLRVLCYCPTRKPITVTNVITVLKMAHYFGFKALVEECEKVITEKVINLDKIKLFQITCAMAEHDRYSPTTTLLIDKLSKMKQNELASLHFSKVMSHSYSEFDFSHQMRVACSDSTSFAI